MSICIISDHIIMLRQNFIIILSIDQVKPKSEGGGSFSSQSPPPPPPWIRPCTILRVSDKASLQEHGQIAVLVLSMPARLPCAISHDVFNGLTGTIHTQQSVLVTGIFKNLMLHDGDRHHWLTVSNLTRNCMRLCYIACSYIALMFELKWLVCDR